VPLRRRARVSRWMRVYCRAESLTLDTRPILVKCQVRIQDKGHLAQALAKDTVSLGGVRGHYDIVQDFLLLLFFGGCVQDVMNV
jgi:hypothetical protein